MNRNQEYRDLLAELDAVDVPGGVVRRAVRRARRRRVLHSLASAAAAFALFALAVNVSDTAAYACSRVPGLRELAEFVRLDRSLSDAVEHNYVQTIGQEQSADGVTAVVEYLIVDQKTVTVFYRLRYNDDSRELNADIQFYQADGSALPPHYSGGNGWGAASGELRNAELGFPDTAVPASLLMTMNISEAGPRTEPLPVEEYDPWADVFSEPEPILTFRFLLEFDPFFTEQGRTVEVNQSFVLDGQTIRLKSVELYPTFLCLNVEGDPANTAWLTRMSFYLLSDDGARFDAGGTLVSIGSPDTPEMISYRADSTWFYDASRMTLYVTGAQWLDKGKETVHVDLAHARADDMPEGTALESCIRENDRWVVTIDIDGQPGQAFLTGLYYDADGNEYSIQKGSFTSDGTGGGKQSFPLEGYPYDEVWLSAGYSRIWNAETPVEVPIPLR